MNKKLGIIILIIVLGLVVVYSLPLFLGPAIFGQNLEESLSFIVFTSRLWEWLLLGTLIGATILSLIFKIQKKPIKKIWVVAGVILGIAFFMMIFSFLMGASSLYQMTESQL